MRISNIRELENRLTFIFEPMGISYNIFKHHQFDTTLQIEAKMKKFSATGSISINMTDLALAMDVNIVIAQQIVSPILASIGLGMNRIHAKKMNDKIQEQYSHE